MKALFLLLLNFPLQFAIREFRKESETLVLNGQCQVLVYVEVNFLEEKYQKQYLISHYRYQL